MGLAFSADEEDELRLFQQNWNDATSSKAAVFSASLKKGMSHLSPWNRL